MSDQQSVNDGHASENELDDAASATDTEPRLDDQQKAPKELGGRDGPDPTRYGDWEKAGRCIDF